MRSEKDPKLLRNVPDKAPEWVLSGMIAKGCVSMVAAPMSMHKTNFGVWVAKEASSGSPLALDTPHRVWFNEQEGDISMQVRPRLMVAGANPDLVTLTMEPWRFPRDLEVVRGQVEARKTNLLILDSVQTHIPGFTSTSPATEAMEGLASVAKELDVAVLLIHHFTKAGASSVRTSIGGAGVLQNLSRGAIFIMGPRPEAEGDVIKKLRAVSADDPNVGAEAEVEKYVLACVRSGISRNPESMLFEVRYEVYEPTKREEVFLALVESCPFTVDQVFKAIKQQATGKPVDSTREAVALVWLLEVLTADGLRPVAKLEEEAKAVGISKRTLQRARAEAKNTGLIEVVRPEELRDAIGDEAHDRLDDESRRGFWLKLVEIGEPPLDEWASGA